MTDQEKVIYLAKNSDTFERLVGCKLFVIYKGEKVEAQEFLKKIKDD